MKHLRVYQLAVSFHSMAQSLGLTGYMRDQLLRASSSVALNLAEGLGRLHSPKDQMRFLKIAFGSIRECQCCLDLIGGIAPPHMHNTVDHLAAAMWKFMQAQKGG